MKRLLLAALLLGPAATFAQRNNIYADIGCTDPGISVTYDYRLFRHLQLGGGVDAYDWRTNRINYRGGIYADLRPYWQIRRSLIFALVDVGAAFYTEKEHPYSVYSYSDAGFHMALGVGYCYRITKRGAGPYITLTMKGYSYTEHQFDPTGGRNIEYGFFDAMSLISAGFKF